MNLLLRAMNVASPAFLAWLVAFPCFISPIATQSAYGGNPSENASVAEPEATIRAAIALKLPKATIAPGEYVLNGKLHISNVANMDIDASGATFIMADSSGTAIAFKDCENVSLHGLRLRYQTLPFTQGTVEKVDNAGNYIDLRIHAGYPEGHIEGRDKIVGYAFSPLTRQWKRGAIDCYFVRSEKLGPSLYRLYRPNGSPFVRESRPEPGDFMAFRGFAHGRDILLENCAKMKLYDIDIRGGSGFCVHEAFGEGGNSYKSISISYPDPPAGAKEAPLISANADGIHSTSVRQGPLIENCLLEGMCDDAIAIHARNALVLAQEGRGLLVASQGNRFQKGDPLRLISSAGAYKGEAAVLAVEEEPGFANPPAMDSYYKKDCKNYRLTIDRDLEAKLNDRVGNPAAEGRGFVIRGNTIKFNRAFGIRIRADGGLIEGNRIEGSTMTALAIVPEKFWNSGSYNRDIAVLGNVFKNCCYFNVSSSSQFPGVVNVAGEGGVLDKGLYGHRNIKIEGNEFEDNDGANVFVDCAEGVSVKSNRFVNPQRNESSRGRDAGVDPQSLIFLRDCEDVVVDGNILSGRGAYLKASIGFGPGVIDTRAGDGAVVEAISGSGK